MNAPTVDPLQLLTIRQVADLMQMSQRWVEQQYRSGALLYLKVGTSIRFRRTAVEALQSTFDPNCRTQLAQVVDLRRAG